MIANGFISLRGWQLIPILKDYDQDKVVLTEKGRDYTAAQLLKTVEATDVNTMYHIPMPKDD